MSIPVLVRSVGPEPSAGYYTQWTTFVPGYPKFKNADTGVSQAFYAPDGVTLTAYRAHYLYFTGQTGEIVDRTVEFDVGLIPGVGEYYDIPVTGYQTGGTGLNPNPGSSSGTAQPSGPARLDITVSESFALSTGDAKVTPWMSPRYVQQLTAGTNDWINMDGAQTKEDGVSASKAIEAVAGYKLACHDFRFSLPSSAKVSGVEVEALRNGYDAVVTSEIVELILGKKIVGSSADGGVILITDRWQDDTTRLYHAANGLDFAQVLQVSGQSRIAAAAFSGTSWVAIGSAGIYRSVAPYNVWVLVQALTGSEIAGVVYGSGSFIATWGTTQYTSSDDGSSWEVSFLAGYGVYLTFTGQNIIRKSSLNTIRVSTDIGVTWSGAISPLPLAEQITGIASDGAGNCVVVGNKFSPTVGYIGHSSDHGATWNVVDTESDVAYYNGVASSGSGFATVGTIGTSDSYGKYSPSGGSWSTSSGLTSPRGNTGMAIGYSHTQGKYLASWGVYNGVDDTISYVRAESATGAVWSAWTGTAGIRDVQNIQGGFESTTAEYIVPDHIYDVGYAFSDGGVYVVEYTELFNGAASPAVMSAPTLFFSGGVENTGGWILTGDDVDNISFGVAYTALGSAGLIAVDSVRMRIHYRADPTTDTLPAKRSNGLAGVAESPSGVKVAVGVDGKILRKPANSPTWASVSSGTTVSLNAVEWVGDRFIAVGVGGIALDGGVDGSAWSRVDTGAVTSLWAIRRVPNTLRAVAVGNDDMAFERSRLGVWSA